MKNPAILALSLCAVALFAASCKSQESAYRQAYERARAQEMNKPTQTVTIIPVTFYFCRCLLSWWSAHPVSEDDAYNTTQKYKEMKDQMRYVIIKNSKQLLFPPLFAVF